MHRDRAVFSSQKTQELYDTLQSLRSQPRKAVETGKKEPANPTKPTKGGVSPIAIIASLTPGNTSERRWTVESSSSKGSQSKSKERRYPQTARKETSKAPFFKSSAFSHKHARDHITVVDFDQSLTQTITTQVRKSAQRTVARNKDKSQLKSRLFTKKQLQSIKQNIEPQIAKKWDVYYDGLMPSLLKCYQQRSWLHITNQLSSAVFLWVGFSEYRALLSAKLSDPHCGQLMDSNRCLFGCLPIDVSKLLFEMARQEQNATPFTIELRPGTSEGQIMEAIDRCNAIKCWIVKPISKSNCSNSFICFSKQEIRERLSKLKTKGRLTSKYVLQEYIDRPFLYNRRKFSIKALLLVTRLHSTTKGYVYDKLCIQSSSLDYKIESKNVCVHFTGYQTQRQSKYFQRYEQNNLISEKDFKQYLQEHGRKQISQTGNFKEKIKEVSSHLVENISQQLKKQSEKLSFFEIFELDFLLNIDQELVLLGMEREPNLQRKHTRELSQQIIDNVLRLTLDAHIPPAVSYFSKMDRKINYFDNVYDENLFHPKQP